MSADTATIPTGFISRISNGAFILNPEGTATGADASTCFVNFTRLTQTTSIQTSQLTTPEAGQARAIRLTQPSATPQRMGLCQTIIALDSCDLRNAMIAVSSRVRYSADDVVMFALLEFDGTADTSPVDPINDWTSSVYIPGQFFKSNFTVLNVGVSSFPGGVWASIPLIPFQANSGLNNLVFVMWTKNVAAQNVTLDLGLWQVNPGNQQLPFAHLPSFLQQEELPVTPQVLASIAALQAETWTPTTTPSYVTLISNYVSGDGGGSFRYDSSDNSSSDNGGTIIVTASGLRFKREFDGLVYYVKWFGNTGTGSGFTAAAQNAITAAGANTTILVPTGVTLTATLTLLQGQLLSSDGSGPGGRSAIAKGFNGDMINMSATQSACSNIYLIGNGATWSGRGFVISSANNYQALDNCWCYDCAGAALDFTIPDAGGGFHATNCIFQRHTNTDPAIILPTSIDLNGGNRRFVSCTADGGNLIKFNAGVNTLLLGCNTINLDFSTSDGISLRTVVMGCRIAAVSGDVAIYGNDTSFIGNIVAGTISLNGAASRNRIYGNVVEGGVGVTDNSTQVGDSVNDVYDGFYTVTPAWKCDSGGDPAIGNGSISAQVIRRGRSVKSEIKMVAGSSTTFGGGNWYFQLPSPFTTWTAKSAVIGPVYMLDSGGGKFWIGVARVAAGSNHIAVFMDNNGNPANATNPFVWAANAEIDITIEYELN